MRKQVQFRLLVVRLGSMGDILHGLPAVTALRKAHPTWRIDWAVEPQWRALLTAEPLNFSGVETERIGERGESRPVVDRVHLVPTKAWGKRPLSGTTWAGIYEMREQIKAVDYEAVLDLQGAIRSGVIARLSGCKRIIGESSPREKGAQWLFTERTETEGKHVIEQGLELASAVAGDLLEPMLPQLPVDLEAEQWCHDLEALRTWKPLVLIHPGAGWGAKRWPAKRYGAVAAAFVERGAVVLVNAGPNEEALAEEVVAASGGQCSVVKSTLAQLIALTRRVSIVIGGDTGPVHLACALDKPVVGVYGPTDPKRNGPYGKRVRVLRNPDSRQDHTRREQTEVGLLTITPDAVMEAVRELMASERRSRHGWEGGKASQQATQAEVVRPSERIFLSQGELLGPADEGWEMERG